MGPSHTRGIRREAAARGERGVVLPLAAAGIVMAVAAAALAVDLGALALERRDLQKVADLAAMDASYGITDLANAGQLPLVTLSAVGTANADIYDRASTSARRNGLDPASATRFEAELGVYDRSAPSPTFQPCSDLVIAAGLCDPDAVQVRIEDDVPRYFAFWSGGARTTAVDAVASMAATTTTATNGANSDESTFSVGSFAGRAQSDPGSMPTVLERLVGANKGSLSADAISYSGIASAGLTLRKLAFETTAGDPEGLLASKLTFGQVLDAMASALQREDPGSAEFAAGIELRRIQQEVSQDVAAVEVDPGSLFHVGTGDASGSAADAEFNVLDLLMAAAMTSTDEDGDGTGDRFLTFDLGKEISTADLPAPVKEAVTANLSSLSLRVQVAEPPVVCVACRVGDRVSTAQLRFDLVAGLVNEFKVTQSDVEGPTGSVAGTVRATTTNLPIAGATVTVEGTGRCAVTDALGKYTLTAPAGAVKVTATAPLRALGSANVNVVAGATTTANLSLPASVLSGGVPLPAPGCLLAPGDRVLASSSVAFPASIWGVQATGAVDAISCAAADEWVDLAVTTATSTATLGNGNPGTGVSAVDVLLHDSMDGLSSASTGLPSTSATGHFAQFPFDPDETQTFRGSDPSKLYGEVETAVDGALSTALDLSRVIPPSQLTGPVVAMLTARLDGQLARGHGAAATVADWLGGGFGVILTGADVTMSDLLCTSSGTTSSVSSSQTIPLLVD